MTLRAIRLTTLINVAYPSPAGDKGGGRFFVTVMFVEFNGWQHFIHLRHEFTRRMPGDTSASGGNEI
jgi:hypothetical protein